MFTKYLQTSALMLGLSILSDARAGEVCSIAPIPGKRSAVYQCTIPCDAKGGWTSSWSCDNANARKCESGCVCGCKD